MPEPRILRVLIRPDPPARLDKALARDVPHDAALSRSRIARLIAEGAVRRGDAVIDDPRARGHRRRCAGTDRRRRRRADIAGEEIPLDVVYEDDDLIVIDKPAGMVVHPAPGAATGTLVNALLAPLRRQPVGDRRRAAPRHRPPDRQGHLGPAGRRQVRPRASRARRAVRGARGRTPLPRAGPRRSRRRRAAACRTGRGQLRARRA